MKANLKFSKNGISTQLAAMVTALLLLAPISAVLAQTVTSDPADGATGVPVTGPIIFTFSSAVDPTQTSASFFSQSPFGSYPVTTNWSSGNTVLTCTPTSPFPGNTTISWFVVVQSAPTPVFAQGSFSTGTN